MDRYMVIKEYLVGVIVSLCGHFFRITYSIYGRRWSLSRSLQTRGEECVGVIDINTVQVTEGVSVTCHPISDFVPCFLASIVKNEIYGFNRCSFMQRLGCDQLRVSGLVNEPKACIIGHLEPSKTRSTTGIERCAGVGKRSHH